MFVTFCTLSSPSSRQRVVSRPCRKDKSHRVNCMVIFASNASHFSPCDLFLKTLRMNFSCDKFLRLVPQNASAVWPLNSWDKSLRPVPSCKLFRGLLAGTSPLVCADLNNWRVLIEKHSVIYRFPCHDLRPLRKRYVKPVTRVRISHLAAFYYSRNFGDGHAQLHNIKTKRRKMKLLGHYIP